ncbi:MAG TPA: bifunctional ornithine acetyltransferase/N-acetylglutamate synthase, partial [Thermoplasmata archaeon]|nr:bifunctional ornithine acetyltransferase/N-acetylglutamate synthase [Thermoplasmata archaeon]
MRLHRTGVTAPRGFRAAGVSAGIKRSGRLDLAAIVSDREGSAAGVFTTNVVRAAPVQLGIERLDRGGTGIRGIVAVSGVANALTGPAGVDAMRRAVAATERGLGLPAGSVLPACTGVIGPPLPVDRVEAALPALAEALRADPHGGDRAAQAILTTDTQPKLARARATLADGRTVTVGGIAKGSGMIAPRLGPPHATTLAFLTTDAPAAPRGLGRLLSHAADATLGMVSVDGDTSTNDTVYLVANGAAGGPPADGDPAFARAVRSVLESLARAIARDGEGATKLLTVTIDGARSRA